MDLHFSPEADQVLTSVEATNPRLAGRLHAALDQLQTATGDARNRRRRFNTIDLWGIPVIHDQDEWLILWGPHPDGIVVHHIIPAP